MQSHKSFTVPTLSDFLLQKNAKRLSLSAMSRLTGIKYSRLLKIERRQMELSQLTVDEIIAVNDLLFNDTSTK